MMQQFTCRANALILASTSEGTSARHSSSLTCCINAAGPFRMGQLLFLILSLGSARVWCVKERSIWREEQFLRSELLEDLRRMLFDLVPPSYARRLVMGCERIKPSLGRVAVLQLDICGLR